MSLPFLFQGSFMINVAAALLPAIYLMRYIYQKDSIEKEPRKLLIHLVLLGVGSAFIAMILEGILGRLLNATMLDPSGVIYNILLAFIVVAVSEEGAKYVLTHLRTWKDPAFNYKFDAVVYCVFTSLGFAAFENVLYVLQGGLGVALMRAVLSIPGHMSFAVVMGVFYGRAKQCQHYGDTAGMKKNKLLAFVWAVVAHGFYDACLMVGTGLSTILFVAFVIFMYVFIFRLIKNEAATDEPVVDDPTPPTPQGPGFTNLYGAANPNPYGQAGPQAPNPYGQQGWAPQGQNSQAPSPFGQDVQNRMGGQPFSYGQNPQAPNPYAPQGQNTYVPPQGNPYAPQGQNTYVPPQGNPFVQQPQEPVWNPTYEKPDQTPNDPQ
ncbi:MAG: PrsW family intramembrane metalloprotease [Lachnospiraceae bacterium]|nr:PrsW family intramembrane metalloprotease [Lachnospiraceae bacterium]